MAEHRIGRRVAVVAYVAGLLWLSFVQGGWPECSGAWLSEGSSLSRADILVNVAAYLPLGALLAARGPVTLAGTLRAVLLAAVLGGLLSLFVEAVQACLPGRVSAWSDLLANTTGALVGALLSRLGGHLVGLSRTGRASGLAMHAIAPQPLPALAALTLLAWIAHRTFPWALGLDVGQLRANLAFLRPVLEGAVRLDPWRLASHLAAWLVFGLAIRAFFRPWAPVLRSTAAGAALVLLLQLLGAVPTISLEELAALGIAAVLLSALRLPAPEPRLAGVLGVAAFAGVALYELRPGQGSLPGGFSWLPLFGAGNVLGALELGLFFFSYAFACALAVSWRTGNRAGPAAGRASRERAAPPAGGASCGTAAMLIASLAWLCVLEVAQLWIPGRSADLSPPLLAGAGWAIALGLQSRVTGPAAPRSRRSSP